MILGVLSLAPAPPAEAPRPPVEHAISELVLIEAYVTDAHGRPLAGLESDDFILTVDGHKSPIASIEFREVAAPEPAVTRAAGEAAPVIAPAPQTLEQPRRFMLFFEDGTSAPSGLTAARHAAREFLSQGLLPSDQVGLAAFDVSLRLLSDFTTDREALRRTIDLSLHAARRVSSFAVEVQQRGEELDTALKELAEEARALSLRDRTTGSAQLQGAMRKSKRLDQGRQGFGTIPGLPEEIRQKLDHLKFTALSYGADEEPRLRSVLGALKTLVDSLADWPGYKAIVYMGDGVPSNPVLPYVERIVALEPDQQLLFQAGSYSLDADLQALLQAAAAAGVTIHTMQTRGLEAGSAAELKAAYRRSNSLEAIALNTGGLSSSSNDVLRALDNFESSSRAYYVLGYQPQGPPDGRFHPVQVRCTRRGAVVRWRRGFTRLLPEEARARAIQAAFLLPELYAQLPIGLSAVLGPAGPDSRIADLVVHLPADMLLFLPDGERRTARLEVGLVALGEGSRESLKTARKVRIALRQELVRPERLGIDIVRRVRLPTAAQSVTAVVLDEAGGLVGGSRLSLPAGTSDADGVLGLSIYSMKETSLWIELPEGENDRPAAGGHDEYTLGPSLKATFEPGEPVTCAFLSPMGPVVEGSGAPEERSLQIVIRQDGRILRTVAVGPQEARPGTKAHVSLPVDGLDPGDYQVSVQEVLPGGPVDRGMAPFRIRSAEAAEMPAGAAPADPPEER
jgi:VWFA-related protein